MSKSAENTDALELRLLEERDIKRLPELYRSVFKVETDEAFWRWKYFQNPAGRHDMAVAVELATGRVVGQTGTIPTYMAYDGRKILGSQVCDIVVLPEYQKGGPVYKLKDISLSESLRKGVSLYYAFSVPKTLKISVKMFGYKNIFPVKRLVRVLNPGHFITRKVNIGPLAGVIGGIAGFALKAAYPMGVKTPAGFGLKEVSSFDGRYGRLMEGIAARTKVMVYRDPAYLDWRYLKCPSPFLDKKIFAVENENEVAGFAVIVIRDEEIRRAYILELADNGNEAVRSALLNKAVSYSYEMGADTVSSWAREGSSAWDMMRKRGFAARDTAHNLIARPYMEDAEGFENPAAWEISMGDSDYV